MLNRIPIALSALLLIVACDQSSPVQPIPDETGVLRLDLRPAENVGVATLPEPDGIKIVVRNEGFKIVRVVELPVDDPTTITVPATDGYVVDALSFVELQEGIFERQNILKHEQEAGIEVVPDETSEVTLVLQPIQVSVDMPISVTSGSDFEVTVNRGYPFGGLIRYRTSLEEFTENGEAIDYEGDIGPTITINAPEVDDPDTPLYFQTRLLLDGELVDSDDSAGNWVFFYPHVGRDNSISTLVSPATSGSGDMEIIIEY